MTAAAIPEERALRDPRGACIADERQELDNQSFAQIVSAVAGRLAAAGLGPGGVLAIMLPTGWNSSPACLLPGGSGPR
jgi:long-chain acyl-CoA synthetase